METVTVVNPDGSRVGIPVAISFDADGPIFEMGDTDPARCDHAGALWSPQMGMRCPGCGAPMFLPPRLLRGLSGETIEAMHEAWRRAGWPPYLPGALYWDPDGTQHKRDTWAIVPERWTIVAHPLFAKTGGLPVRHDKRQNFPELVALAELSGGRL